MLRPLVGLLVAPVALISSVFMASQFLEARTPEAQPNPAFTAVAAEVAPPRWVRGQRVPLAYRQDRYVIRDWKAAGLTEPPSGYRWLKTKDGPFVLYGSASGFIAEVVKKPPAPRSHRPR